MAIVSLVVLSLDRKNRQFQFLNLIGSHVILSKRGAQSLVIPSYRSLAPFLLRSQIRRAGLSEEEFLELLK